MPKIIINLDNILDSAFKQEKMVKWVKTYFYPILIISIFFALGPLFVFLEFDKGILYGVYFIILFAVLFYIFRLGIKNTNFSLSRERIISRLSQKEKIEIFDNNEKLYGGDEKLWEIYKSKLEKIELPKLNLFDWLDTREKLIFIAAIFAVFFAVVSYKPYMLFPDVLRLNNQELNLNIISDNEKIANGENFIAKNQTIKISFNGVKAIKVKYGDFKTVLHENETLRLTPNRSAHLKIYYYGQRFNANIKFIKTPTPQINGKIAFQIYDNGVLGLKFNGENIGENNSLKLIGLLNNSEIIIPDAQNGVNNIIIDPRQSVLMGQKALILLKLGDTYKLIGIYKLPKLQLKSELAKTLNEARIGILKETSDYKKFRQYYDSGFNPINSRIDSAPNSVKDAHNLLNQILRAHIFEDDLLIGYIFDNLQYANSLSEAKIAANMLWEIIKTDLETNSIEEVISAINALKSAIENQSPTEDIEALKNNLRDKINQHLQNLAQSAENSKEQSDSQQADNSMPNIDGQTLEDLINGANLNPDGLDNLKEILKNLSLSNGAIDIKSEQSKILENIQNADANKLQELAGTQNKLNKATTGKLPKEVTTEMQKLQKSLAANDKETAQKTGEKIMELLNNGGNANNFDKGKTTKIPDEPAENKAHNLIKEINKRLENNNGDNEERNYLEDILKNAN